MVVAEVVVELVAVRLAKIAVPVKVGEAEPTTTPEPPVSSVRRAKSSADVSIEVEEILLLKIDQSAEVRQPLVVEFATSQVTEFIALVRPEEKESPAS